MKLNRNVKDECFIIVVIILMISLIVNVYQSVVNDNYKIALKKQSYDNIEAIRYTNETILTTLQACIDAKKISNEELLLLYKNYNSVADYESNLWQEYIKDENNLLKGKLTSTYGVNNNQIYWEIEELIYLYLQNDLKNDADGIELEEKVFSDFEIMKILAEETNNLYIDFYDENCNGLENEKKEAKMIKKNYWVDIFEGIQEISDKYVDYPFIYEGEN